MFLFYMSTQPRHDHPTPSRSPHHTWHYYQAESLIRTWLSVAMRVKAVLPLMPAHPGSRVRARSCLEVDPDRPTDAVPCPRSPHPPRAQTPARRAGTPPSSSSTPSFVLRHDVPASRALSPAFGRLSIVTPSYTFARATLLLFALFLSATDHAFA